MKPELRRMLPFVAAFVVGALGSLLVGTGPRSSAGGDGGQAPWALPAAQDLDLAAADAVWADRHPWGEPPLSAAEAAAQEKTAAVPVGVVKHGSGLRALFSLGGALPVAVEPGGQTPDGGTVASIAPTVVTWKDAEGQAMRVELFLVEGPHLLTDDDAAAATPPAQNTPDASETEQGSPVPPLRPPERTN